MDDPRDWLSAEPARRIAKSLLYAAVALCVFLAFLIGKFPYAEALSRILAPSGVKLDYTDQHLSFPFGATLDNVRLRYTEPSGAALVVESPRVMLSPTLASLLLGQPGLRVNADLFDGTIHATVTRRGSLTNVRFTARGVNLARLRDMGLPNVDGRLSGDGWVALDGSQLMAGEGRIDLSGKRLSIRLAPAIPPLRFDEADGMLTMNHRVVEIEKLEGHGGDFSLLARGTIQLAQSLPRSMVDLTVTLDPTPAGREHFGILLGLLPHPPEQRPYTLRGPLMFPSIS